MFLRGLCENNPLVSGTQSASISDDEQIIANSIRNGSSGDNKAVIVFSSGTLMNHELCQIIMS